MSADGTKKFVDGVNSDLRALSNETRRKFHPVKEVWILTVSYRLILPFEFASLLLYT